MEVIKLQDLPVKVCEDLRDRYKYWTVVRSLGKSYYIPVSKKALNTIDTIVPNRMGRVTAPKTERYMQDVVAALFLQIRESVGDGIQAHLEQKISEGFQSLLQNGLNQVIRSEMENRLPAPQIEEKS